MILGFKRERKANKEKGRRRSITVETFVPSKWRFVDLETGDVWNWSEVENTFDWSGKLKYDGKTDNYHLPVIE